MEKMYGEKCFSLLNNSGIQSYPVKLIGNSFKESLPQDIMMVTSLDS